MSLQNLMSIKDLKEMALGTGFGIRYDLGFFVVRVDMGFKTYNPALGNWRKMVHSI